MEVPKARAITLGYYGVDLILRDSAVAEIFYFKTVLQSWSRESESRELKVFTGSRSRKKDFSGVGVRVEKYMLDSRLPVLHKNLIKV